MTSFAIELERVTGSLAALCRPSFGPCGEGTLLFQPPDAPVVTSEGHAVLATWKRGLDAGDPLATYLLTAADGVYQQLGDASSEFILLLDAATRHTTKRAQGDWNSVGQARLSRAFGELKWQFQREIESPSSWLLHLRLSVSIDLDTDTKQPLREFRDASTNILASALRGLLGERALPFFINLVLKWIFTFCGSFNASETIGKLLFRRAQQFLKCAPDAIIFMVAPSVYDSCVVPQDDFILKKSLVASQSLIILDKCQTSVHFACLTCSLSLEAGSTNVKLATTTEDELFTAHDAAHLFILKFLRFLRDTFDVQLLVSTKAIDESVIAACTRQSIACVQLAEPEDVEALCIHAGIVPVASVFDEIRVADHIGLSLKGVSRVNIHQQAYLRLCGLSRPGTTRKGTVDFEQDIVVPQLLIYAPSKGVYKQYYAAIVKSLRVLRSWWEPVNNNDSIVYTCRGGGATELAVARWLQDANFSEFHSRDPVLFSLARNIIAMALIEVVSTLRNNLSETNESDRSERFCMENQRQIALTNSKLNTREYHEQEMLGYTLDYSRIIQTAAGPIQIPELVSGDPAALGLIHPWRRIETLLFLVLESLEQLLRIDKVLPRTSATKLS